MMCGVRGQSRANTWFLPYYAGKHTLMFAASDSYGKSVTLLRAIGLRYGAVVMIRGGLACSILYLRRSEVKIFTAKGFVNHVTSLRKDLYSRIYNTPLLNKLVL